MVRSLGNAREIIYDVFVCGFARQITAMTREREREIYTPTFCLLVLCGDVYVAAVCTYVECMIYNDFGLATKFLLFFFYN